MCTIDIGDDCATVFRDQIRRARKEHTCDSCQCTIAPGDKYLSHASLHDGHWSSSKICKDCDEIRDAFARAHDYFPFPSTLEETLEECIAEGDEESDTVWGPMLARIQARREAVAMFR